MERNGQPHGLLARSFQLGPIKAKAQRVGLLAPGPIQARGAADELFSAESQLTRVIVSPVEKRKRRLFEATKYLRHRFVGSLDSLNGFRAGDDADLIGLVMLIVCLPQGVAAPAAAYVSIDDRHKIRGFARSIHELNEPRGVSRVQRGVTVEFG